MKKKVTLRMQHYLKLNFGSKTLAYDLLADYPTRPERGFVLCFVLQQRLQLAPTTTKQLIQQPLLSFLHNSFLIKDDIVDQSIYRRGGLTLNRKYGLALAANAGDAVKILAMSPLIDNLSSIGVRKSLQIIMEIQETARTKC